MKKAVNWAMYTGSIGFMLNGIIGIVKLLHGNNKVAMQAHLAVVFFVIAAVGIICKILLNRCPNCRKSVMTRGEYCPYCGEKIKKSNELLDGTVLRHEWFKSRKSPISPADGKNEAGEKVRFHKKAVNWVQAIALVAFVVDLCFIAGEWVAERLRKADGRLHRCGVLVHCADMRVLQDTDEPLPALREGCRDTRRLLSVLRRKSQIVKTAPSSA